MSATRELWRYACTRFSPVTYAPLALLLVLAAAAGVGPPPWTRMLPAFALAGSLLFQFRLWDDLADLAVDRRLHPDRILVRSPFIGMYQVLVLVVALLNLAAIFLSLGKERALACLLLDLFLLGTYGAVPSSSRATPVLSHLPLLKYPVLVFILSGFHGAARPGWLGVSMLLVYLSFCAHELLHDPVLRREKAGLGLLRVELIVLATSPVWISIVLLHRSWVLAALQGALVVGGSLAAVQAYRLHRAHLPAGALAYGPFVLVLSQALILSMWRVS